MSAVLQAGDVAIHKTVMYTKDRQYRITADPAGNVFTVERHLVFEGRFTTVNDLITWLTEHGIDIADLIED